MSNLAGNDSYAESFRAPKLLLSGKTDKSGSDTTSMSEKIRGMLGMWLSLPILLLSIFGSIIFNQHLDDFSRLVEVVVVQSTATGNDIQKDEMDSEMIHLDAVQKDGDRIQVRTVEGRMIWLPDDQVQIVFEAEPEFEIRIG